MSFLINPYQFGTLTDNLIAYFRFNNNFTDQVGNFTPTVGTVSYQNGIWSGTANESVQPNSSSSVSFIADDNLLSFGDGLTDSPFSFSFGVQFTSVTNGRRLFSKRGNGSSFAVNQEYDCFVIGSVIGFAVFDDSASANLQIRSATTPSTATPYHVVITYDGGGLDTGLKMYIDGSLESVTYHSAGSYTAMENLGSRFSFFQDNWGSASAPVARFDGMGIWNIELSASQVTEIYNTQSAGNELL